MARITVLLEAGNEENEKELKTFDAWTAAHADQISFIGENEGCGCCVHIWNIECDEAIISLLPHHFLMDSEWSRTKEK